ncbi:MAG: guanylate kinase [Ruminococcaceae bacterium]|nr:guanylate kinase [Oscillospiraceae bacterium]
MSKGKLFIISGPSGSGKDTVMSALFQRHPEIKLSISSITRPMRTGEVEGEKYHFISREEFESMIEHDQLLEHNVFVGNYYGTPKKPVIDCIESGSDMILEVDVNGAKQIKSKMPEAISIFIMPPSYKELERRLIGRGTDSMEVIEKRLSSALGEIARASEYDYVVTNDVVDRCVDDILHIILAQRLTFARQSNLIEEVLNKC